jgi:outer membrane protein
MPRIMHIAILAVVLTAATSAAEELTGVVSVEECLRVALGNRPELAAADAQIEAARQRLRIASSRFLPEIGASYGFARQQQTLGSLVGAPSANQQTGQASRFNFQRGRFALNQLVFNFGKTVNETREATARRESTQADRETVAQDVALNVRSAYYTLIAARRLLVVAEDTEAQTRRQLEESRSRYEVGAAPRFDVTQQEVQVANAELLRLTASNQVALGRENLRDTMGLSQPILFEPDDGTLDYRAVGVEEDKAVQEAYARRPELQAIVSLKRAQREQIAALKKDYLPSVDGTANYDWTGSDAPEDESWLVGANVRLLIFNGGRTGAQVGESRAELLRLEADERTTRQRVMLEVRQSVLDLRVAEKSIGVTAKAVEQASESLAIAEGRYSAGVGNILEVSDAQVGRARARADHVQALADYWIAVAEIERAVGAPMDLLD